METIIRTEGLTHEYETRSGESLRAIKGIDLEIGQGEFVAIVGHNGSGKSTLAKHFNALLLPTEGIVTVAGLHTAKPENLWEVRRRVGMVFQNPDNQIVATTVEEDVAFGPENLGLPSEEIRTRVDEALRAVEMLEFRGHAPHRLSGGQKQRVAIAGVIAMRPACIVLDEPTAMLDPGGRAEVMGTIRRLNKEEGITVLLITHFMDEAVFADRVVVMEEGRIAMSGAPADVFRTPARLRELHLDVPPAVELAQILAEAGLPVQSDILSIDGLADELVDAFGKRPAQSSGGRRKR